MPTLKAIRRRISSVKSTQQITRAVKLISAARLRRAQEALMNARPYSEALSRLADSLLGEDKTALAPAESAQDAALIVLIASDRGQCGAYNVNMIKLAEEKVQENESAGRQTRIFVVGRKAVDHFKRNKIALAGDRINNPRLANVGLARDIANYMMASFRGGEVSEVGLIYSKFRSAISQRPLYERVLPISAEGESPENGASGRESSQPIEYLVEPSRAELVPLVVKSYVEEAVFHGLLEAEASEHGARMTAMENATNNATEMIGSLTLEMNRARQAQITRELMDIVGGAEALRG